MANVVEESIKSAALQIQQKEGKKLGKKSLEVQRCNAEQLAKQLEESKTSPVILRRTSIQKDERRVSVSETHEIERQLVKLSLRKLSTGSCKKFLP